MTKKASILPGSSWTQLNSVWDESDGWVPIPVHAESDGSLTIVTSHLSSHDSEPESDAISFLPYGGNDGEESDSKYSLYGWVFWVFLVLVAHLLLFWWLDHRSDTTVYHPSGQKGEVYHASLVRTPADQQRVERPSSTQSPTQSKATATPVERSKQSASSVLSEEAPHMHPHSRQKASSRPIRPKQSSIHQSKRVLTNRQSKAAPKSNHQRSTNHVTTHARPTPSVQSLIQQVVDQANENSWQQAAAMGPSNSSSRNAIDRYIAYFTQTVQSYIDLNLGAENVADAQMTLVIRIARDGHLLSVKVSSSTGYKVLDKLAVKTIYEAGPFRSFDFDMGNIPELNFSRVWIFGHGSSFHFR